MNKIDKLDKELEKAREKAAEWQAKIREPDRAGGALPQTDARPAYGFSECPQKQPYRFGPY